MPIRLPDIPGLQQTGSAPPQASLAAAMTPAKALGSLASGIASISDAFASHADKIQQTENARLYAEKQNAFAENYSKFQLDVQKQQDPAQRLQMTNEWLNANRPDTSDLTPEVASKLDLWYGNTASQARINAGVDAFKLSQQRAGQALDNQLAQAVTYNDPSMLNQAYDTAVGSGLVTPEEAERGKREGLLKIENNRKDAEALSDPKLFLEQNPRGAAPSGVNAVEYERRRGMAERAMLEKTADATDLIQDQIAAGQITTPQQIEAIGKDLRPTAVSELKSQLARQGAANYQAQRNDPTYQAQIIGRASSMIDDYKPDGQGFDSEYVAIAGLIKELPDSVSAKDELMKQLNGIRSGKEAEIRTHADEAMAALKDARKNGRFGQTADQARGSITVGRAVADGLLEDKTKLLAMGFSPSQAAEVAEAAVTSDGDGKKKFIELFDKRAGTAGQLDPLSRMTYEAIRSGAGNATEISYLDPEKEDDIIQTEERYGRARAAFADWIKVNPNATATEIDNKIFELGGEEAKRKLSSGFFDAPRPRQSGGPLGADPSTSQVPVGKDLKAVVKQFEAGGAPGGFHRTAYWDSKQWSIGYGTRSKEGEVIDQAEAERRLDQELASHRKRVDQISAQYGLKFTENEKDALTSFDFNTGRLEQLLAGGSRSKAEIADKILLYRNADGRRLRGLENRRIAERNLFLNGYS